MQGLFYSIKDKKLFYVPDYYTHGTGMLEQLIKNLKEGESVLRRFVPEGKIYCDEIKTSRKYKGMWYFSVTADTCPDEAFKLGRDWTMWAWLTN